MRASVFRVSPEKTTETICSVKAIRKAATGIGGWSAKTATDLHIVVLHHNSRPILSRAEQALPLGSGLAFIANFELSMSKAFNSKNFFVISANGGGP